MNYFTPKYLKKEIPWMESFPSLSEIENSDYALWMKRTALKRSVQKLLMLSLRKLENVRLSFRSPIANGCLRVLQCLIAPLSFFLFFGLLPRQPLNPTEHMRFLETVFAIPSQTTTE